MSWPSPWRAPMTTTTTAPPLASVMPTARNTVSVSIPRRAEATLATMGSRGWKTETVSAGSRSSASRFPPICCTTSGVPAARLGAGARRRWRPGPGSQSTAPRRSCQPSRAAGSPTASPARRLCDQRPAAVHEGHRGQRRWQDPGNHGHLGLASTAHVVFLDGRISCGRHVCTGRS
ncbi:unnamed protein product, partial [Prorocentrum cordatum]